MQRLLPAALVVLALAAGACAAKDPSSNAASGKGNKAQTAEKKSKQPWWKLSQYSREPKEKPWVYGDVRPGKGLLSDDEDGFVLMRQGEGRSSDPSKPAKVKR